MRRGLKPNRVSYYSLIHGTLFDEDPYNSTKLLQLRQQQQAVEPMNDALSPGKKDAEKDNNTKGKGPLSQ
ncbi:hypothetical protein ACHQM5_021447 [Ranunculus cassubicifolius]